MLGLPPDTPLITRDQVRHAKPDPDLFLAAADLVGADVRNFFVIGDSTWDLLAARRAGTLGIGLLAGGYGRDELERAGAYRVYADPADLLEHLTRSAFGAAWADRHMNNIQITRRSGVAPPSLRNGWKVAAHSPGGFSNADRHSRGPQPDAGRCEGGRVRPPRFNITPSITLHAALRGLAERAATAPCRCPPAVPSSYPAPRSGHGHGLGGAGRVR